MAAHKDSIMKARKGAASRKRTIAAATITAGNVTLTTQSGCPDHEPQLVDLYNSSTSAATARYTDFNGTSHADLVPPGQHYPVEIPVTTLLATSDSTISAKCYWWAADRSTQNP
jgi:hypothetical protein